MMPVPQQASVTARSAARPREAGAAVRRGGEIAPGAGQSASGLTARRQMPAEIQGHRSARQVPSFLRRQHHHRGQHVAMSGCWWRSEAPVAGAQARDAAPSGAADHQRIRLRDAAVIDGARPSAAWALRWSPSAPLPWRCGHTFHRRAHRRRQALALQWTVSPARRPPPKSCASGRAAWSSRRSGPVAVSLACHTAIRAGEALDRTEMEALVRALLSAEDPFRCPHGRPVVTVVPLAQIEKGFGRR